MSTDVAIVGMGCVLPHGEGTDALDRVLAGEVCAAPWHEDPRYLVGAVPPELVPSRPGEDRAVTLAIRAAEQVLASPQGRADAPPLVETLLAHVDPGRIATVFTVSKGGLDLFRREILSSVTQTRPGTGPWIASVDPAAASRAIALRFGLRGPAMATAAACASGGYAMAAARAMILDGRADAVVCGAADSSLQSLVLASYGRLGLLAPCGNDGRPRGGPFCRDRCGFYVGEGAACFVLTAPPLAERLALPVLARLCAAATGSTAADLMAMPTDGRALSRVAKTSLEQAGFDSSQLDLVAVHGTATRDGDLNEARALERLGSPWAARVPVLATKHLHGHLLGAACAVETAIAIRVLGVTGRHIAMRMVHVDHDGEVASERRFSDGCPVQRILKWSAGFGGHMCSLVLAR